MGKLLLMPALLVVLMFGLLNADEWVSGYYRSNGTWVDGYWRTTSDNSLWNNYSTQGNVNPYTHEKGYESPYKVPSYDYALPELPSYNYTPPELPSYDYALPKLPSYNYTLPKLPSYDYALPKLPSYNYTPRTEWVSGYYRSNGTWVNGYWRTR
ncbi:MAG: hypothetical protein NTX53_20180 [candidate division WOR-3 bacterium]|nr:hypothetical protein [candidate division WOR-3 bacterium]